MGCIGVFFCFFQLGLGGRLRGLSGKLRVAAGAADRAGASLLQRLGQNARLFVQKGLVFRLIRRSRGGAGFGGVSVFRLQIPEYVRFQRVIGKLAGEGLHSLFPGFQLLLLPKEQLLFLPGVGQGRQFGFQFGQVGNRVLLRLRCFAVLPGLGFQLALQPRAFGGQAFQCVIAGQLRLGPGLFGVQTLQFRETCLLLGIGFPKGLTALRCRLPVGFRFVQGLPRLFLRFQSAEGAVHGFQFLFQAADLLRQGRLLCRVPSNQRFQEGQKLAKGQFSRFRFLQFRAGCVGFVPRNAADVLRQAGARRGQLPVQRGGVLLQSVLQALKQAGFEHFPQNLFPFLRRGQQEFQEIPLGDHGDLHELAPVDAHDVPNRRVHIFQPGLDLAVGIVQHGLRLLLDEARAPCFRAPVFRAACDGIGLPPAGEHQLHLRGVLRRRVFGAQHRRVTRIPAGLAVQGKGDGVKECGLSRAGVPGDQIQAAAAEFVQVQDRLLRIGSERGHAQFQRSHASPSQVCAISSVR